MIYAVSKRPPKALCSLVKGMHAAEEEYFLIFPAESGCNNVLSPETQRHHGHC